jgi:hypothetical protein
MNLRFPFALPVVLLIATFHLNVAQGEIKNTAARSKEIDRMVDAGLAQHEIEANAPIDDAQFIRRIYLAAVGRIPTGAEARAFMESSEKNKRDLLVDQLLESEGYVSHFYNYWADILRINRRLGRSGASNEYAYKQWVKESLRSNRPYDEMVYELISANGDVWDNGATGYYHRDRGMPLDNMANTVRVFLGTRLECAQCHDHPFDEWSQLDFFRMASFTYGVRPDYSEGDNRSIIRNSLNERRRAFSIEKSAEISGIKGFTPYRRDSDITKIYANDDKRSVSRRRGIKTEEEYRELNNKVLAAVRLYDEEYRGITQLLSDIYNPLRYATVGVQDRNAKLPHDYQYENADPNQEMMPVAMFGDAVLGESLDSGYLDAYAGWMTAKSNPRFTQVIANRLWKKAFGLGLVEPVDEFMSGTDSSNAALFEYLEQSMKEMDYDMKSYLAMLFKSQAWQRQACTEELAPGDVFHFPGPVMQRMSAEQIWDSVVTLTIPDADHYQPTLAAELQSIDRDRKIRDALESHSPEEFQAILDKLAAEVSDNYAEMQVVREKYLKARQEKEETLARQLSTELRGLTAGMRKTISEVAYQGADGRVADIQSLMKGTGMAEMSADGEMQGGTRYVRSQLPRVDVKMPEGLSRAEKVAWTKKRKSLSSSWRSVSRAVMRASELPTPAPRGHFLREFGQSDRELIENANSAASVPQALNLMNSNVADVIAHPNSILGQALAGCDSPEQEIQTIYQLMLTRQPSENEMGRLLHEYAAQPKKAQYNIVWALLNTQQFIFAR